MHANNIDHRDLKPLNILLFNNADIAKIADFGLAKEIVFENVKMTSMIGSPLYLPPEVYAGEAVPFKGDVYCLGLILHYMMAKDLPTLNRHVKPGTFDIPKIYSDDIIDLMKKMLKKKPEQRSDLKDLFGHKLIV